MPFPRPLILLAIFLPASAAAQTNYDQPDPFEQRFKEKSHFQIKFHVPEKGGEVRLYTKNPVHFEKDVYWEGSEEVRIEYQDVRIACDYARYEFPTKTAFLKGNVVIDQGPMRITGDHGFFNLETKTGTMYVATAYLPPTYNIVADSIDKIGEATYKVHHGTFTSCEVPKPAWSFRMSEATVTLDDYARMHDVTGRARELPLFYTPYLVWPTKEGRVSGLLTPGIGYTEERGAYLGLTHYLVTGRSTDLTTQVDLFSKGTVGLGEEFRWTPSAETAGIFQGYFVHDTEALTCVPLSSGLAGTACTLPDGSPGVYTRETRNRWKIRLDNASDDLPWGLRGVVSIHDYSDPEFLQDFERSFALVSLREILSSAFLTKNFGVDSLNLRFERSETFLGATVLQERMPSLEYYRRTSEIGDSPFYLAAQGSLSNLFIDNRGTLLHGGYGRADFHPVLSFPWKGLPWLSVTASASGRWTGYTDSTDPLQQHFTGSSTMRAYAEGDLSIVGPSFSRIYEVDLGPFGKFKHIIEPRIDYTYVSNVSDPLRIPVYDDIDTALGQNQVHYAIVNRLLAKGSGPNATAASEIASLEVGQTYAFEPAQTSLGTIASGNTSYRNAGPIDATLRVTPGGLFMFDGRLTYDPRADQLTSSSITTALNWKSGFFNMTWFSSRPVETIPLPPGSPSPNSDQLRFAGGAEIFGPFRIDTEVNYDVQQGLVQEDRTLLTYKGSCYTLFLEVRQLRLPGNYRNDVRFVLNLKDIGTLLDMNGALRPNLF